MKQFVFLIICLLFSIGVHAQTQQAIPYQAFARDSSGNEISAAPIYVRFSIREGSPTGAVRYQEIHHPTTTTYGLFSVSIGTGTVQSGVFSAIKWSQGVFFLQTELSVTDLTSFFNIGTQQLMSVPYSLHAESVKLSVSTSGDTLFSGNGYSVIIPGISAANCIFLTDTIPTRDNNIALGNPSNAVSNPSDSTNYLISRHQFTLSYNNRKGIANWVSWHLSPAWKGTAPRCNCFTQDAMVPSGYYRATTSNYTGTGFDRGHLCPSDDRDGSDTDNAATFKMTVTPVPNSNPPPVSSPIPNP